MKFLLFGFLTYLAAVDATDSVTRTVTEAVNKAVTAAHLRRGLKDPLEMTDEDHERETLFFCSTINGLLPDNISCDCTTNILQLRVGFTCAAAELGCQSIPSIGDLCSKISVSGTVSLSLAQLAVVLDLKACAEDTLVNSTTTGEVVLGDICANIDLIAGFRGAGITGCSLAIFNRTCESCSSCTTGSNSTGIQFACPTIGNIDVCVPISIPIFVREGGDSNLNPALNLKDVMNTEVWDALIADIAVEYYHVKQSEEEGA
jgi:hypothetical protein